MTVESAITIRYFPMWISTIITFILALLPCSNGGNGQSFGSWTSNRNTNRNANCGRQALNHQPLLHLSRQRIIGGNEAEPHSWPWMVFLNVNGDTCGATVIPVDDEAKQSNALLTAAHCVTKDKKWTDKPEKQDVSKMYVLVGIHHRYGHQLHHKYLVADVILHPNFTVILSRNTHTRTQNIYNDIAVIILASTIDFTDTAHAVCLPEQGAPLPISLTCVVAGWGVPAFEVASATSALRQVVMPVIDQSFCRAVNVIYAPGTDRITGVNLTISERELRDFDAQTICAGRLDGFFGPWHGDSGGMLVCSEKMPMSSHVTDKPVQWTLYGIVSQVAPIVVTSRTTFLLTLFTRVSYYADWINEVLN